MNSQVEFVDKNMRYRVIIRDKEYYILDMEQGIWALFFPFLFWIIPQKMYKVSKEKIDKLNTTVVEHGATDHIAAMGTGLAMVGAPLFDSVLSGALPTSSKVSLVIIIIYSLIVVSLRIYFHNQLQKRMRRQINLNDAEEIKVWIRPIYFKQFIMPLIFTLFLILAVLGSINFIISENTLFTLFSFVLFFPLLLLSQVFFVHTEIGKTNRYYVKILDRNI